MHVLPTPPFGEKTTIRRPGDPLWVDGVCDRARHGACEQLAHAVDGLMEARFATDHDRVARTGAKRLLEHIGREFVHREHRADLRMRSREPVHMLEAERTDEARTEDCHDGPSASQLLDEVFDRLELTRRRPTRRRVSSGSCSPAR